MARPFALDPLFQSTKTVTGVGPRMEKLLQNIACSRIVDLFWHLPFAVIDRRYEPALHSAESGKVATVTATVEAHFPPKRPNLPYKIKLRNETGFIDLMFFNVKGDYLEHQFPVGETRTVSGKLEHYNGYLQMPHPDYIVRPEERGQIPAIEPVYPLTAGLTQKVLSKIMRGALTRIPDLHEWLDPSLMKRENWVSWQKSLQAAHNPQSEEDLSPLHPARQRLAYDEVLSNQLTIELVRLQQTKAKGRTLEGDEALFQKALAALPFTLTKSQELSVKEIRDDMRSPHRMHRLLQGDVGSGKTAVAFLAMVHAIGSGGQAVIMAPTEILARQHEKNLTLYANRFNGTQPHLPSGEGAREARGEGTLDESVKHPLPNPLPKGEGTRELNVVTLTGRDKGKTREKLLEKIASGEATVIIGTHALFQEDVIFKNLALVIIDEQHRFGVHQRLLLSEKGALSDMLVMTATPIPRTLTLTVYGDMDVSRLTEKPAGRQPIETVLISNERIGEIIAALQRKVETKDRIYWVCPLVEESEKLDLAAAEQRYLELQNTFGPRTGLLHGRMKPTEKDKVMESFSKGDLDILVSTTVIEVGVDVPEATVMVIEHAERFGLAQLHQLRGRIGRGSGKSVCILLYNPQMSEIARKRLATIRDTEDGFVIAEEDLKLRGAGEMLGTRQSGLPEFRLASAEFHGHLIEIAFSDARHILSKDSQLTTERGQALRTLLYLFERDTAIKYLKAG